MDSQQQSALPPVHAARAVATPRSPRAPRAVAHFVPYITRNIPYYEVLGEEGLALMEHNADTILQEIGIDFRDDPECLQIWKAAGADVQGERVRFPRGMCRSSCRPPRRASSRSTRAIRRATWSSAATAPCSRLPMARPSCATSMRVAAMRASRTSATS